MDNSQEPRIELTLAQGRDEAGSQLIREESRIVRWGECTEAREYRQKSVKWQEWGDIVPQLS